MFNPRKTVNCDYLSCTKEAKIEVLHSPEIDKLKEVLLLFTQLKVLTGSATKKAADGSDIPITEEEVGLPAGQANTLSTSDEVLLKLIELMPVYAPGIDASTH